MRPAATSPTARTRPGPLRVVWDGPVTLVNDRLSSHWAAHSHENASLRAWAAYTARGHGPLDPCTVEFLLIWPDGRLPDTDAACLAGKHIIDGLVDAGVIADDGPDHVQSITYHASDRGPGPAGIVGPALMCLVKGAES